MIGRPKTSTWGMVLTLPGVVTTISGIVGIAGPAVLVRLCGEGSGRSPHWCGVYSGSSVF